MRSAPGGGDLHAVHDHLPDLRAAMYRRETPGRRSHLRLEQRVGRLAGALAYLGACHVATSPACSLARPWTRPGLS